MRLPSLFGACDVRKVRGAGENVDRPISFFGNSLESLPGTQGASCSIQQLSSPSSLTQHLI